MKACKTPLPPCPSNVQPTAAAPERTLDDRRVRHCHPCRILGHLLWKVTPPKDRLGLPTLLFPAISCARLARFGNFLSVIRDLTSRGEIALCDRADPRSRPISTQAVERKDKPAKRARPPLLPLPTTLQRFSSGFGFSDASSGCRYTFFCVVLTATATFLSTRHVADSRKFERPRSCDMSSTVIPLLSMAATWLTVDTQRLPAVLFVTASSLPTLALAWWMFAMSIIVGGVIASYQKYAHDNSYDYNTFPSPPPRESFKRPMPSHHSSNFDASHDLPKVSILRPLKGLDCNIESNLLSSFRQDYPVTHVELIFCVADETDPVIPVVQSLMARHPHHNSRLVVGDVNIGVNPKINNLIRGYESAANDIVWIVDSNIWVAPGTLIRSVRALTVPGIGLVHHLPVGVQPTSLGSELEMLFLNSVHARAYLAINQLGPSSCVIGKSTLFRRSDLQICGGLRAFGKYMAEDNMIGQAIWDLGLRHAMTPDRAWQPLGSMGTMDFFNRRQRWGRIRKFIVRAATLAEPLSECVLLSAFFAYAAQHFADQWFAASLATPRFSFLYFAHAFAWMLMDYWVSINVTHAAHLSFLRFARAWIIREISCLPTYAWAMSGSTVSWRNFHYQLQPGGTVQLLSLPCDQCGRSRLSLHGYSGHHVCTQTKPGNNSPPAARSQPRVPNRTSLLGRAPNGPAHDISWMSGQRVTSQIQHWLRPLLLQQFGPMPSKATPATRKRRPSATLVVLPSASSHSSFDVPLLTAPMTSSTGFPIQRGRTPSVSGI